MPTEPSSTIDESGSLITDNAASMRKRPPRSHDNLPRQRVDLTRGDTDTIPSEPVKEYIELDTTMASEASTEKRRMSLTSSMLARVDEDFAKEMAGELFQGTF